MSTMKKIAFVLLFVLWMGGIACGVALGFIEKAPMVIISTLVLGALSFPTVRKLANDVMK